MDLPSLLVHFPKNLSGWGQTVPKPRARSLFLGFHMGSRAQTVEPSTTAFPGL